MKRILGISTSRLPVQPILLMKVVYSIASSSCLKSIPWLPPKYCSELRSITQTLISLAESASISWRTNGLQHSRLELCFFQFKHSCLHQILKTHLMKQSLSTGERTKMELYKRLKIGLWITHSNENQTDDPLQIKRVNLFISLILSEGHLFSHIKISA